MNTPRGLRNNNPGNIRLSRDHFQGEVRPSSDTAFKQFETMGYGYRAVFAVLATYREKGFDTIRKIISRWAPPSENNTNSYIQSVEKLSGVPRDKVLTANDGKDYLKIVAAISEVENGVKADILEVEEGFSLQSKIK
jgi:hypothetical protein